MDMLIVALNDTTQPQQEVVQQSRGTLKQKTLQRREVVKVLPKKADSLEEAFEYVDGYGKIRFGYFGNHYKEETPEWENSFASAIGGIIGIKTASFKGFSVNAAAYISQDLPFLYDTDKRDTDFFTKEGESFTYLAEASIDYHNDFFSAKVGRFAVDLPYANTDDLRMAQNTFEGAWGNVEYNDMFSSQLFFIQRWAGFDSQDDTYSQNEFKKLAKDSRGMIGASVAYAYNESGELSFWYQNIENFANIAYTELNGAYKLDSDWNIDYGLQYSYIAEDSNSDVDGQVYGAMLIVHYDSVYFSGAANFALVDDGKYVTDGFGGGPYFTSLDEATIAAASEAFVGEDIDMYRTGVGVDFDAWYSSLEYAYGYMQGDNGHIDEHDIVYSFNKDDNIVSQIVFASYKGGDTRLNRVVARIDYNF